VSNKSTLYDEARRCADAASRGVTPDHRNFFSRLAIFYSALAKSEPDPDVIPGNPPAGFDARTDENEFRDSRFHGTRDEPLPIRFPDIRDR
jgi:hypothetical protein